MQNISTQPSLTPFEPEQTHTMGLAFDAAWAALAARGGIAACDVEEKRDDLRLSSRKGPDGRPELGVVGI